MTDGQQDEQETGRQHHQTLETVHDSMLAGLGQLAEYFGFSKVMGQLYGALLMSPQPLSLDDMMDLLSISKASVSMNMRTLEHMGMVRQAWVRGRGDRRKFYEAETDFWQIISNIISGREMRDVERALLVMNNDMELLKNAIDEMSPEDQQLAELYQERIAQMRGLFLLAQAIINTVLTRVGEMGLEDIEDIDIHLNS